MNFQQHGKRFKTAEDASEALRTGDFSKAVPYGGKEWEDAVYEVRLVFNQQALEKAYEFLTSESTLETR